MTSKGGKKRDSGAWQGALYAGKRAKLRKIAFAPATHVESGKNQNGIRYSVLDLFFFSCRLRLPDSPVLLSALLPPQRDKSPAKKSGKNGSEEGSRANGTENVMQRNGGNVSSLNAWRITFRPGAGLHNLGNTCFMNSVLQCLTYTPPLAQSCLEEQYNAVSCLKLGRGGGAGSKQGREETTPSSKFDAMQVFQRHVNTVLRSPGGAIPPHMFSKSLKLLSGNKFRLGRQEDAHEYFRCLVESMEKSFTSRLKTRNGKKPTQDQVEECFIYRVFGGKLRSQIHCTCCDYKSNKYDPILDLSLEIFRTRTLEKALNLFTSKEVLDGNNKYSCPKCKGMVRAVKQMLISEAPNILAIQLKRFAFGKYGMKIENKISFPLRLDMSQYISRDNQVGKTAKNKGKGDSGPIIYSLYGVLVHSGHSLHSGHYYCYVKCPSGAWVCCDDDLIQQVSEKKVMEQKAYMLFYCKEGHHPHREQDHLGKGSRGNHKDLSPSPLGQSTHAMGAQDPKRSPLGELSLITRPRPDPTTPDRDSLSGSPMMAKSPRSPLSPQPRGFSMSPSLQKSKWKRFLMFLPKLRLQVAGGMTKVRREIKQTRRRRSLDGEGKPRRSKRIQLMNKREESEVPPLEVSPNPSSSTSSTSSSEEDRVPIHSPPERKSPRAADVQKWLRGDGGTGVYGVPVKKWQGPEAQAAAAQAGRVFQTMKPAQKRRTRYDEEYDMGKVKKVKDKKIGNKKRLNSQNSAFQRAAKGNFDAKRGRGRSRRF